MEKAKWLPLPATESALDIARFITQKYEEYAEEEIPKEKLMPMLYLCIRDASYATQHVIVPEKFEIANFNQVQINISLPSISKLKSQEYNFCDLEVKQHIEKAIKKYVVIETWRLKKEIGTTFVKMNRIPIPQLIEIAKMKLAGKSITLPPDKVTLEQMWVDAKIHRDGFDYFEL